MTRVLVALLSASCAGPIETVERDPDPPGPTVDLALAEQHYREHATAIDLRDLETYRASLADPATCLEDEREVRPSEIDDDDLPVPYHIVSLELEALPYGGARVREWVVRAAAAGVQRIEPRVVDLLRIGDHFRVARIVSVDRDCGAGELLRGVEPSSEVARCSELVERCRASAAEAGTPSEFFERHCEEERLGCLLPREFHCGGTAPRARVPPAGTCSSDRWCVVHPDRPGPGPSSSVWGRAADDLWVGTPAGLVHYDGTSWAPVPEIREEVRCVRGAPDGTIAVVAEGSLYVGDGRSWRRIYEEETSGAVYGIGGRSSAALYAVGHQGLVMRCDREACLPMPRVTSQDLCGVIATADDVTAFAGDGTLVRGDGATWRVEGVGPVIEDAAIDARGRVILVGRNGDDAALVVRREGGAWIRESDVPEGPLYTIVREGDALVAFGAVGAFRRTDGPWSPFDMGEAYALRDAWSGAGVMVLATDTGVFVGQERAGGLSSVARTIAEGSVPDDLWVIVGEALLRWNGQAWSVIEAPFDVLDAARLSDGRVVATTHDRTAVWENGTWSVHEQENATVRDLTLARGEIVGRGRHGELRGIFVWSGDRWQHTLAHDDLEAVAARDRGWVKEREDGEHRLIAIAGTRRTVVWRGSQSISHVVTDGEHVAFRTRDAIWVGRGRRFTSYDEAAIGGEFDRILLVSGSRVIVELDDGSMTELDGRTWTRSAAPEGVHITSVARVGEQLWATAPGGVVLRRGD